MRKTIRTTLDRVFIPFLKGFDRPSDPDPPETRLGMNADPLRIDKTPIKDSSWHDLFRKQHTSSSRGGRSLGVIVRFSPLMVFGFLFDLPGVFA